MYLFTIFYVKIKNNILHQIEELEGAAVLVSIEVS